MALIYMCTRLTVNISQIYMPMYITETLHMHKVCVVKKIHWLVAVKQYLIAMLLIIFIVKFCFLLVYFIYDNL